MQCVCAWRRFARKHQEESVVAILHRQNKWIEMENCSFIQMRSWSSFPLSLPPFRDHILSTYGIILIIYTYIRYCKQKKKEVEGLITKGTKLKGIWTTILFRQSNYAIADIFRWNNCRKCKKSNSGWTTRRLHFMHMKILPTPTAWIPHKIKPMFQSQIITPETTPLNV